MTHLQMHLLAPMHGWAHALPQKHFWIQIAGSHYLDPAQSWLLCSPTFAHFQSLARSQCSSHAHAGPLAQVLLVGCRLFLQGMGGFLEGRGYSVLQNVTYAAARVNEQLQLLLGHIVEIPAAYAVRLFIDLV